MRNVADKNLFGGLRVKTWAIIYFEFAMKVHVDVDEALGQAVTF